MNKKLIIPSIALATIALAPAAEVNAQDILMGLFPSSPVIGTLSADPNIQKNKIELTPSGSLASPIKDLATDVKIEGTLPLLSARINSPYLASRIPDTTSGNRPRNYTPSNDLISMTLQAGFKADIHKWQNMNYQEQIELLMTSPAVNDRLSGGTGAYLGFGLTRANSGKIEDLSGMNLLEFLSSTPGQLGWNLDLYIMPKYTFSKTGKDYQIFMADIGIQALPISGELQAKTSINADFPISKELSAYFSAYFGIPVMDTSKTEFIAKGGFRLNDLILSGQVDYKQGIWTPGISVGIGKTQ